MGLGTGRVTHREYRHEGPYFVLSFLRLLFCLLCGVIFKRELKSILSIISATGFTKKTPTRQYSSRENRSFHGFSTFDMDKIGKIRMQITYPITYFPSNWNILTVLPLFDLLHFILYYFVQAEFFHVHLSTQDFKKNLQELLKYLKQQNLSTVSLVPAMQEIQGNMDEVLSPNDLQKMTI